MREILKNKNKSINQSDYEDLVRKYECFIGIFIIIVLIFLAIIVYYIGKEQQNKCVKDEIAIVERDVI